MENLIDTAWRYGDKADLAWQKALELCEKDAFYVDCEDDEDQPHT